MPDKTIKLTIQYGLVTVDQSSIPEGYKIVIKDYDVQPEEGTTIDKDEGGVYFTHEYERLVK